MQSCQHDISSSESLNGVTLSFEDFDSRLVNYIHLCAGGEGLGVATGTWVTVILEG